MAYLIGALIAVAGVVMYEVIFDSRFSWALSGLVYDVCEILLYPFAFFWYMTRLLCKGISAEQYREFILAPGTYSVKLIGRIYYVHDATGSKFLTRHALLRVRR